MKEIFHGNCLDIMPKIEEKSVDLILCDLPYGTTQCKWDVIIPFDKLWESYNRLIKENGAIVLTSAQPFTSRLICSNIDSFKYTLVWEKSKATGYLNAKKQPMRAHEDICVFYNKPPIYNPQMTDGEPYNKGKALRNTDVYGGQVETLVKNDSGKRYPRSVLYFKTAESEGEVYHPTQKPISLFEYIIKTYTNENGLVLDNCLGSGTTAIACVRTNRNFIGIESDEKYYNISAKRIKDEIHALKGSNEAV